MVISKVFISSAACKLKLNESKSAVADCGEVRANLVFLAFFFFVNVCYLYCLTSKEPVMGYYFENQYQIAEFYLYILLDKFYGQRMSITLFFLGLIP